MSKLDRADSVTRGGRAASGRKGLREQVSGSTSPPVVTRSESRARSRTWSQVAAGSDHDDAAPRMSRSHARVGSRLENAVSTKQRPRR